MKALPILLFALLGVPAAGAERPIFSCTVAGNEIRVFMEAQGFQEDAHELSYREGAYGPRTLHIDGREPVGTDNTIPTREFKRFTVFWNGKERPIPKKLYQDFYQPNLDPTIAESGHSSLRFIVAPNGEWIQVLMFGSDGAGSYVAAFHLASDGGHRELDPRVFEFSESR